MGLRGIPGILAAPAAYGALAGGVATSVIMLTVDRPVDALAAAMVPGGVLVGLTAGVIWHTTVRRRRHRRRLRRGVLPPDVDRLFTGRSAEMDWLEQAAPTRRTKSPTIQVLAGLSGVGKTQVAVRYLAARGDDTYGWWLPGDAISRSFAAIRSDLELEPATGELIEQIGAARELLAQSKSRWILVLDDVHHWNETLRQVLPRSGRGQIVISSTNADWQLRDGVQVREITSLDPRSATALLWRAAGRRGMPTSDAYCLTHALGYLPLAVQQAGAYLARRRRVSIRDYLDELAEAPDGLLDSEAPDNHESVWQTWNAAMNACRTESLAADSVMQVMTVLAHIGVPEWKLVQVLARRLRKPDIRRAVDHLVSYSLLTRGDELLFIHSLVADVVWYAADTESRGRAILVAAEATVALIDDEFDISHTAQHAAATIDHYAKFAQPVEPAPALIDTAAHVFADTRSEIGGDRVVRLRTALHVLEEAEEGAVQEEWKIAFGHEILNGLIANLNDPDFDPGSAADSGDVALANEALSVLSTTAHLRCEGRAHLVIGRFAFGWDDMAEARHHYEVAAAIFEIDGNSALKSATAFELARCAAVEGRYEAALAGFREARSISCASGDIDTVAAATSQIVTVLRHGDRLGKALHVCRLHEAIVRSLGDDNAVLSAMLQRIAILHVMGRRPEAIIAANQIVDAISGAEEQYRYQIGPLLAVAKLGVEYGEMGVALRAQGEAIRVLRVLSDLPGLASALTAMAGFGMRNRDLGLALQSAGEAAEIYNKIANVPEHALALGALSSVFYLAGNTKAGDDSHRRAIEAAEAHGDFATVAKILSGAALAASLLGDSKRAIRLGDEVLRLRLTVDVEPTQTLEALDAISGAMIDQGDASAAIRLREAIKIGHSNDLNVAWAVQRLNKLGS